MAARNRGAPPTPAPATDQEFAAYTRELLHSLRKVANERGLGLLEHLLDIAAAEAARLAAAQGDAASKE